MSVCVCARVWVYKVVYPHIQEKNIRVFLFLMHKVPGMHFKLFLSASLPSLPPKSLVKS